jgi:hypothetical protein
MQNSFCQKRQVSSASIKREIWLLATSIVFNYHFAVYEDTIQKIYSMLFYGSSGGSCGNFGNPGICGNSGIGPKPGG